jgi:hypothetical protein
VDCRSTDHRGPNPAWRSFRSKQPRCPDLVEEIIDTRKRSGSKPSVRAAAGGGALSEERDWKNGDDENDAEHRIEQIGTPRELFERPV